ncbi:small metal-binding protein SmbP [Nitrosomonas europaea]|uniref:small metal-binding protein SmbP n=1 Tax=Nitrosomonas europaea TaxID=915 RepID=UPI0032650ACD
MKKILSILSSTFILSLFMLSSVNAQVEDVHLQEAIRQTEAVVLAVDVKTMTQLAQEAERYAVEVKSTHPEDKHLQEEGLKHLNDVIKESRAGEAAAARKAAIVALSKFNQIESK